jgi:hypothetical protein
MSLRQEEPADYDMFVEFCVPHTDCERRIQ